MYGIVDAGLSMVTSNAGNQFAVESGALHGDRWGLKSTEALGGGLKAVFQIENGFSIASGQFKQGGREFGRQAYVGLKSDSMGTVTLGRQYDPNVDLVQGATADRLFGGTFGTPGDIDNYDNTMRINNSVKYLSSNIAGLSFEAIYGFSGLAGQAGEGQSWGVGARYTVPRSTMAPPKEVAVV